MLPIIEMLLLKVQGISIQSTDNALINTITKNIINFVVIQYFTD